MGRLDRRGARRPQAGLALVLVLWSMVLLSVIAGSFVLGVRREAATTHYSLQVAAARAAAEAGVRLAMLGLAEAEQELHWRPDGTEHRFRFEDAELRVSVRDEAGRIDINYAAADLIDGLLRNAGVVDEERRELLRDNILDWREPGPHPRGAAFADGQYRAAALEYGPRDAPFLGVEELLLIPGMDRTLYRRLAPMITTHSRQPGVNPAAASREVLAALPGVAPEALEEYMAQRDVAREQGLPDPGLAGAALVVGESAVYGITAVARMPSGLVQGVRVVVVPEPAQGGEPFRIVHYRPDGSS